MAVKVRVNSLKLSYQNQIINVWNQKDLVMKRIMWIQGGFDGKFLKYMAVDLKMCTFDSTLVKPKCVLETVLFEELQTNNWKFLSNFR